MLRLLSSSSISLSLKRYNNKLSLLKCFSVNSSINHNINILNDDDNDDVKVQKLLAHWPLDHRQRINDMIRLIGEDSNYENIAKGKFISPSNWLQYITASRRKLGIFLIFTIVITIIIIIIISKRTETSI